jgi:hypothetical protein
MKCAFLSVINKITKPIAHEESNANATPADKDPLSLGSDGNPTMMSWGLTHKHHQAI